MPGCRGDHRDNLRLGRPSLTRTELSAALDAVGLTSVVEGLPAGLDTPLAPTGAPLSLTQVMRLMLARAIVGRPRLLVVDQTLDALSPNTRGLVLEQLLAPDAPWTLLVFTQDPFVFDAFPTRHRLVDGQLAEARSARALEIR